MAGVRLMMPIVPRCPGSADCHPIIGCECLLVRGIDTGAWVLGLEDDLPHDWLATDWGISSCQQGMPGVGIPVSKQEMMKARGKGEP